MSLFRSLSLSLSRSLPSMSRIRSLLGIDIDLLEVEVLKCTPMLVLMYLLWCVYAIVEWRGSVCSTSTSSYRVRVAVGVSLFLSGPSSWGKEAVDKIVTNRNLESQSSPSLPLFHVKYRSSLIYKTAASPSKPWRPCTAIRVCLSDALLN